MVGKKKRGGKTYLQYYKKKGHKSKYLTDTKMQQIWLHDILRTIAEIQQQSIFDI